MRMRRTAVFCLAVVLFGTFIAVGSPVVGGGGPMPSVLFLELDDLNDSLLDAGYATLPGLMFMWQAGGQGGEIDGIRIGGYGGSGDISSSEGDRVVTLDMAYGGLALEKGVRSDADMVVVLGTLIGGGGLDLRLISYLPNSFDDAIGTPYVSSMSKAFFALQPYVAFETQPTSWLWSRLQLGFLWTLAGAWEFESTSFDGPPSSFGGLSVQMMFRFGGNGESDAKLPAETAEPTTDAPADDREAPIQDEAPDAGV